MGFTGGQSFLDALDELEDLTTETGHRMADRMTDHGMGLIERNTPVQTRHLRESYKRTEIVYGPMPDLGVQIMAWTGRVFTEVEYADYVEFGTGLWGPRHKKYEIRPKNPDGVLAFSPYSRHPSGAVILNVQGEPSKAGRTVYARFVLHPGSPGHHMFQIGTKLTEMEMDEWSRYPLELWQREVDQAMAA